MIPGFLRNRKTYMLTAIVFTIIGVLSLSFAFFNFNRDADLLSQNVIMIETLTIDDITKSFTVSYEKNNASLETGILDITDTYSDIMKFKVISNYDGEQEISINWNFITSTLTKSATSYELYTCTNTNFESATVRNVSSLCTSISPTTGNMLPASNEKYKLTSADSITLASNLTQYYIAKINIESSNTGKSFTGTIAVKHTKYNVLTLNLDDGEISCAIVSDMPFGKTITIPIPIKTNYIFSGWTIVGETDSVVNGYSFTMGTSDTTLLANWTKEIQNYTYTGGVQLFTVPQTGTYQIEAWGAKGGDVTGGSNGGTIANNGTGYGAYTKGEIYLEKDEKLYIYVGKMGASNCFGSGTQTCVGGWNGGGTASTTDPYVYTSSGGGATDIRYFSSTPTTTDLVWNSESGLNSRIMVAAGGSGSYYYNYANTGKNYYGVAGGGLYSGSTTQTIGNAFGEGQTHPQRAGGGGYYGGYLGNGGSSYISGHKGCASISSISSRINLGNPIHFTQKYFLNTLMLDGNGNSWTDIRSSQLLVPNPSGGSYAQGIGNPGNGYARITFKNYEVKQLADINNEKSDINTEYIYSYVNNYQKFIAPKNGIYQVETWGAKGGNVTGGTVGGTTSNAGIGYGAYTKGEIYMEEGETLYIYTGSVGDSNCVAPANGTTVTCYGGYNGGGNGATADEYGYSSGGGGATDIRYFHDTPTTEYLAWNNTTGLNSRIMIAAGGSGAFYYNYQNAGTKYYGVAGGGIFSGSTTQTIGSSFGTGASNYTGGGGGGYYGGYGLNGGSSYISGHIGCASINNISDRLNIGSPIHFTNKYFTNTLMLDGNGNSWTNIKGSQSLMPNYYGGSFSAGVGNTGNGFAKILLKESLTKTSNVILQEISSLKTQFNYSYTNTYQLFITPKSGTYKIETWGAIGGNVSGGTRGGSISGLRTGYGSYSSGNIYLPAGTNLYVYVGSTGNSNCNTASTSVTANCAGGYNGGGDGYSNDTYVFTSGGGGATDIRYFSTTPTAIELVWNSVSGLNNRIMVAAGGSGAGYYNYNGANYRTYGSPGGGLLSRNSTQYSGSSFGVGGSGSIAGGGGGYYGGTSGPSNGTGSGGSSYISGHAGCLAINDLAQSTSPRNILTGCTSSSTNKECSYHILLTNRIVDTGFNSLSSNSPISTIRITSNINTLSALSINNGTISFNASTNTYNVIVDASTTIISATKTDSNSSISGDIGSKNLSYGLNTFKIIVTSESGTKNTYTINITRLDNRNTDTSLNSLTVSNTNIVFNGSDSYNATVENNITKVNINATSSNATSTITGLGSKNLVVGKNTFKVVVKTENGATKTYTIIINRKNKQGGTVELSNNNNLKSITIKDQIIDFNKDIISYSLTVPYNIDFLKISYEVEDSKSTADIESPDKLSVGLNTYTIKVTSESNEVKIYTINVTRKDERTIVDNDNTKIIEAINNNDLVYVNSSLSGNINVSKEVLKLLNDNKSLIYEIKDKDKVIYSVTINNKVINSIDDDINIGLTFNKENDNLIINSNDNIGLTYIINVSEYYKDKDLLYLYHYAKDNPRLLKGSIEVNDGYINLDELSSDKYILSNELINKENRNIVLICIITAETILLVAAIIYIYTFKFKSAKKSLL